jgi:prepilin-type N-terminal cleavage/methylation domain-containing protein
MKMFWKKVKMYARNNNRGFTLIEMLVSIAIFIIVTAVVLAGYRKFGQNVLTTNLAYEIALSIREAQVYGMSVKETASGSLKYTAGYGVDFSLPSDPDDGIRYYTVFIDNDNSRFCTLNNPGELCKDGSERLKVYDLPEQSKIEKICGVFDGDTNTDPTMNNDGKSEECDPTIVSLSMVFTRPNPEASIRAVYSDGSMSGLYKGARIYISSYVGGGSKRVVEVWNTGQIAVR